MPETLDETRSDADRVVAWLKALPNTAEVRPVRVLIKGTTYHGASYVDTLPHDNGSVDNRERLYLLGDLPCCYQRSSHTVFRFPDSEFDWYVACYMPRSRLTPDNNKYHPGGPSFMLMAWNLAEAIDRYERRPYVRVVAKREEA